MRKKCVKQYLKDFKSASMLMDISLSIWIKLFCAFCFVIYWRFCFHLLMLNLEKNNRRKAFESSHASFFSWLQLTNCYWYRFHYWSTVSIYDFLMKKKFEWPSISGKNFSFLCPQNSGDNSFSYRTATYGSPCIRNSEGFRIKLTEPYVVSETILDSAQYWWNFHVVLSKENKPFFTLRNLKTLSEKTTKRLSFHETENSSLEKWRTLKVRWKTYFFRVQAPTVDIDGVNISSILDTTMLSLWRWE